jgi:hypothetical protein
VIDALESFGISHLDLPLNPERLWRVVNQRSVAGVGA